VATQVTYERIDLIRPESYQYLLADLRARTGLDITRCEIGKLDFLHDVAEVKIYYTEPKEPVVLLQPATESPGYSNLFEQDGRLHRTINSPKNIRLKEEIYNRERVTAF